MSIAWNYLDKRSAAMAALKDYRSMKAILATTAEEIANVRQDMVRIGGMRFEESAHGARNPQAGENQILHGIAEIDVLEVGIPGKCSKIKFVRPLSGWNSTVSTEFSTSQVRHANFPPYFL